MYKVSIIMPVYNCEKYLESSLDSIKAQSMGFENIEVGIVNDASTDGTKDIIDEYAKKYPNIKPVHLTETSAPHTGPETSPSNMSLPIT